jgi:hypothetical protein
MNLQSKQEVSFVFELLTEGTHEADIALVNTIGQEVSTALQNEGGRVQSVSPPGAASRGGEFLAGLVTFVATTAVSAWVHRDAVLADAGALVEICTGVVPVLRWLLRSHKQHAEQINTTPPPPKITLEIDGAVITVEAADIEDAEAAAFKLAQRFLKQHPTVARKATTHSKVKAQAKLPPQPRLKRR